MVVDRVAGDAKQPGGKGCFFRPVAAQDHEVALADELLGQADAAEQARLALVARFAKALEGRIMASLFYEPSTRTRFSFESAMLRLGGSVITTENAREFSSAAKGESLSDSTRIMNGYADVIVMRHFQQGAPHEAARWSSVPIINGGDGRHAHPTQGMLDMLTIRRHKGDFEKLSVAIVGDILHSRVARSNMLALKTLGCPDIRVIGPKTLLPVGLEQYGVSVYHDMNEGLRDVDVVIMLRLQRERMQGGLLPSEGEFYRLYGLTTRRMALAKPDAIVMHPGPMNRGVAMDSEVADGPRSVILEQVSNGIAVRMAVMSMCIGTQNLRGQGEDNG